MIRESVATAEGEHAASETISGEDLRAEFPAAAPVRPAVPYRIEVSGEARRGLHRLPAKAAAAIIEFIAGHVAENPARLSKPLTNELDGYRTARRGGHRVLVRIDESARVLVVRIDHRADIYRTR